MESLAVHLSAVAVQCKEFAASFGCGDEGKVCGLLHALGKLGLLAQRRIQHGKGRGIDHWSFGAYRMLTKYETEGVAAAMAILAYHQDIGRLSRDSLTDLDRLAPWREQLRSNGRTLSESSPTEADTWLASNNLALPKSLQSICPETRIFSDKLAAVMADVRMLFLALVDAYFLETEAHFAGNAQCPYRPRKDGAVIYNS